MRKVFWLIINLVSWVIVAAPIQTYNPYYHNALADIRLHVVDDLGEPVEGAMVSASFYIADTKAKTIKKPTDSRGIFEARHQCNWELSIFIQKDGYYNTDFETKAFITVSKEEATKTHKWSNGTVDIPVVLKKMRTPTKLSLHGKLHWPFPATNVVVGLDLEMLEWCPPYGNGKHKDMSVLYEAVEHPEEGWMVSFWRRLTLAMPNVADGFYRAKKDPFSRFEYDYAANTNAVFAKTLVLEAERKNDHMTKNDFPPNDEYFIFRTRTATNSLGVVVHANYGRIAEKPSFYFGLTMRSWFNPKPNDTNLEDARSW